MTRRRKNPLAKYRDYTIIENLNITDDNSPRVIFIVNLFQCACNAEWESSRRDSREGMICKKSARCIENGPVLPYNQVQSATPYQNPDKRYFGLFHCHKCARFWMSAWSWAEKAQKCQNCTIYIYPFRQHNLRGGGRQNDDVNPYKQHQNHLCQKCKDLGLDCSKQNPRSENLISGLRALRINNR